MNDPTRQAKLSRADWSRHKETIIQLYLDEDLSLKQLAQRMETDHGFTATTSQFEFQLKSWRVRKNLKAHEWKPVLAALDKAPGTRTRVLISGRIVPEDRIHRARRHCNKLSNSSSSLGAQTLSRILEDDQICVQMQKPDGTWTVHEDFRGSPSYSNIDDTQSHRPPNASQEPQELISQTITSPNFQSLVLEEIGHINDATLDFSISPRDALRFSPTRHIDPMSPLPEIDDNTLEWGYDGIARHLSNLAASRFGGTRSSSPINTSVSRTSPTSEFLECSGSNNHRIRSIMLNSPTNWLNNLPFERLENVMKETTGGWRGSNTLELRPNLIPNLGALCFVKEIRHTLPERAVSLLSLIQSATTFLPNQGINKIGQVPNTDRALITGQEVSDSNLFRLIIFSMMNGLAGLQSVPIESVVQFLDRFHNMGVLVSQLLQLNERYTAKAFAETLLFAALEMGEMAVTGQLLVTGLVDDAVKHGLSIRSRLSPEAVTKLINSLVDRVVSQDVHIIDMDTLLDQVLDKACVSKWELLIQSLLKAGARLTAERFRELMSQKHNIIPGKSAWSDSMHHFIASRIDPSQHDQFIKAGWLFYVARALEDTIATELVQKTLSQCRETHGGACIRQYQHEYDWGVITAAKRGSYDLVRLQLSQCRSLSKVLSAAIRSGNESLIELVMAQRPNINDVHCIENNHGQHHYQDDLFGCIRTSALAEALRRKNTQITHSLESAGVLEHLSSGNHRFYTAITAAIEVKDLSYTKKLFDNRPSIETETQTMVLCSCVRNGWNEMAMELLDAGVRVDEGTLHAAVEQRNSSMVRAILNADICGNGREDTLKKAIEWGDESIIMDLLSTFHHGHRYGGQADLDNIRRRPIDQYQVLAFAKIAKGDSMFNLLLGSKLATEDALTNSLSGALVANDIDLLQRLIDHGADPLAERVLKTAMNFCPHMLHILFQQSHKNKPNLPRGLRTNILKSAIRHCHGDASLAKTLINSTQFDIFDVASDGPKPSFYHLSPLGEAINLSNRSPDSSLEIVAALLDAGCKANDVVECISGADDKLNVNQTALLKAIEVMNKDVVQLLLGRGANVNEPANFAIKRTPLQKAAEIGSLELVRMLLGCGADVNGKAAVRSGGTALQMAAIGGNCNVAAELLVEGASLHTPPPKVNGRWPLEGAAEHGRLDMIDFLWRANQKTLEGETGFEKEHCLRAMELAGNQGHFGCRDRIAELSGWSPPQAQESTLSSRSRKYIRFQRQ